jgi:uncharacterized membrane protein YhaH (DUF805 family)
MPVLHLLFGFSGRINRLQYWLGCCAVSLLAVLGIAVMTAMQLHAARGLYGAGFDPLSFDPFAELNKMLLSAAPFFILMLWTGAALQAKRFRDRGRSGWLALIPVLLAVSWIAIAGAAIAAAQGPAPSAALAGAGHGMLALSILTHIVSLLTFIDLGLMPSKEGPSPFDGASGGPPQSGNGGGGKDGGKPKGGASWDVSGAEAAIAQALAERAQRGGDTPAATFAPRPSGAAPRSGFGRRGT